MIYNGSSWVAVGSGSGISSNIYYSDNSVSWYPVNIKDNKIKSHDFISLKGICFADNKVVIGNGYAISGQ